MPHKLLLYVATYTVRQNSAYKFTKPKYVTITTDAVLFCSYHKPRVAL